MNEIQTQSKMRLIVVDIFKQKLEILNMANLNVATFDIIFVLRTTKQYDI